jgi:RNA polymerase subunit RPABC4/transcription elongation factor Spt4
MAIGQCSHCGKAVSTEAATCPHCGGSQLTSPEPSPSPSSAFRKPSTPPAAPAQRQVNRPERPASTPVARAVASTSGTGPKLEEMRGLCIILLILDVLGGLLLLFLAFPALVVFGLLGLTVALIARSKGRDTFWWFVYGFGVWLVALPHALLMKPDVVGIEHRQIAEGQRKCPFCAEMIKVDAKVCRYCGRDLPAT